LDTDEVPVPMLENPIQQFVIARMLKMTDTAKAAFQLKLAESARIDTRVQAAGA
jgi:hypothetical protein